MTKREMARRIEKSDFVFLGLLNKYRNVRDVLDALLDHFGLELKTEPASPERVVLVKKAKAGGK